VNIRRKRGKKGETLMDGDVLEIYLPACVHAAMASYPPIHPSIHPSTPNITPEKAGAKGGGLF
jgi:hypothetical protein